jgi:uncharacterized repeat protein (TIGR01451 family)
VLAEQVGEELVVYDPQTECVHHLNDAATFVFRHFDDATSIGELADKLAAHSGLPVDEGIVQLALYQLDEAGLLQARSETPAPRLSRRTLIAKLGLGAGAALMLPVIKSIVAPDPVFAQSFSLAVSQSGPTTIPNLGSRNYVITIQNGPVEATNVMFYDTVPAGLTIISAPGCTIAGQLVTCDLGTLAPNEVRVITITIEYASGSAYSNSATVQTDQGNRTSNVVNSIYDDRPAT